MDYSSLIYYGVGLLLLAGVIWYRTRTGEAKPDSVSSAVDTFWRVSQLVGTYATAADQLLSIGALKKEDRLEYVIDMVLKYTDELDIAQIRGIVEAWVADRKVDHVDPDD